MTATTVTGTPSLATPFRLLVDECPIAIPALCILFGLRRVIERELDVMKGTAAHRLPEQQRYARWK